MKRIGIITSVLLTVTVMLLTLGVVPVAAVEGNGADGAPEVSIAGPTPITIGANWYTTMTDVPPRFVWYSSGEPVWSDTGPYTFTNAYPVRVDVTDAWMKGDQFRIYDNDIPIGDTSSVPEDPVPTTANPDIAFADPTYSSGSFELEPGTHSISIEVINNPWDSGAGYIRVMATGITPSEIDEVINSGESIQIEKVVQTPIITPKPDILFMADTTGSMGPAIADVQAKASQIMNIVLTAAPDAQFGVANYKDYPVGAEWNPYVTLWQQQMTSDTTAVQNAINAWTEGYGFDWPEGWFASLDRAVNPAPPGNPGWRPDSAKIIVLFGDAPAHDPVPPELTGLSENITEASLTADLVSAGVKMVFVSCNTSYVEGLNLDPILGANDYQLVVPGYIPGGTAGQATRIAAATGGVCLNAPTAGDVADYILSGLTNLPVTVSMTSDCSGDITTSFDPPSQVVTSGSVAVFTETISVAAGTDVGIYNCQDWALIDGKPMVDEAGAIIYETKTIRVPADFGDALDPTYPTLLASNGARHGGNGPYLGASIDYEMDGQTSAAADGDDINNTDDEDGVTFDTPVRPNGWAKITVTASAPGFLNAWIDFNIDGDWDDPDERVFSNQPLVTGANPLSFWVPYIPCLEAIPGDSFARFRFFNDDTLSTYDGYAPNGEVEDYMVPIGIPVGGEAYPVNKASILVPWIALAAVIVVGGLYLVRRRAHS